mgnify:CR=1 FL=1
MIGDFTEDDVKVALLLLDNIEDVVVVVVVVAPVVVVVPNMVYERLL